MERTTLYLPADLHRTLRETARREGRTQADLLRQAVEEYLKRRSPPLPRSIGVGDDPGLSSSAVKAWLHGRGQRSPEGG